MGKHSVLAFFAHPDDETSSGPLLARCAAEGHDVYLASVTSGQKGFRPHFNMPAGDRLGAVREDELRCAARALGIHEPYLFGFQDQGISTHSVAEEVAARLREIVEETKADVLLTWGPDGITGHPDHRMASNIAAVVFGQQGRLVHKPRKLYFVAFPESRFAADSDPLKRQRPFLTLSDEFVTTEIDCREYLAPALAAIQCHKTQWQPERMLEVHRMYERMFDGRVYLRLAVSRVPSRHDGREASLFEGLE
ncbi:MAG: PIG-L family deacetylase [Bryobacteraceae bacterium]|jgi:LmbE family N-acetylglucosaminyl deacetylase